MADERSKAGATAVEQHVRKILAQISALKDRLGRQERAQQSGSRGTVEVDREGDRSCRTDYARLPA